MRRLVIVSDCTDVAFAEMRGTLFTYSGESDIQIEPLAPVQRYSIINTSFVVRLVAEAYPSGSVICAIVNSIAQRTERIIGRTVRKNLLFEGTNTGAFGWLVKDLGCAELFELADPGFVPFGGKRVHAPALGRALLGVPIAELGMPFPLESLRTLEYASGLIVHVDNFGNIKFPYEGGDAFAEGARFMAAFSSGYSVEVVYGKRMMEHPTGTWVLYPGSSFDLFEIGQVRSSGFERDHRVRVGDRVVLHARIDHA